jgi:hypothetical protein
MQGLEDFLQDTGIAAANGALNGAVQQVQKEEPVIQQGNNVFLNLWTQYRWYVIGGAAAFIGLFAGLVFWIVNSKD